MKVYVCQDLEDHSVDVFRSMDSLIRFYAACDHGQVVIRPMPGDNELWGMATEENEYRIQIMHVI
jgi:hypothetical protein